MSWVPLLLEFCQLATVWGIAVILWGISESLAIMVRQKHVTRR